MSMFGKKKKASSSSSQAIGKALSEVLKEVREGKTSETPEVDKVKDKVKKMLQQAQNNKPSEGSGGLEKFGNMQEAKLAVDIFMAEMDQLDVGDYVVLSDHGESHMKFPRAERNQIGKIVGKGFYKGPSDAQPYSHFLVAMAINKNTKGDKRNNVDIFQVAREDLVKYDTEAMKAEFQRTLN